jgi:BASS family bile acid:Na+ symporter
MTLDLVIRLGLLLSVWMVMLALGSHSSIDDVGFVLRRPWALMRPLAVMYVLVPAFAILVAAVTLVPPIKFAVVAMAVGPTPALLPRKQLKAGSRRDYVLGLFISATLVSIVVTPVLVAVAAKVLRAEAIVTPAELVELVLLSVALPFAAGVLLRLRSRRLADRIQGAAERIGRLLFIAGMVLLFGDSWSEFPGLLGHGGAVAITAVVAVALLAGHLLGGREHRTAAALAAANRHPGVAFAIAEMSYPHQHKPIMAALLFFLIVSGLSTAVYLRWTHARSLPGAPVDFSS